MSRRIFLVPILIALIWSGALIATRAIADRECFEDSCRLLDAAEPAPAESAPAESAPAEPAPAKPVHAEAAPAESAPAEPAPVKPAYAEAAPAEPPIEPPQVQVAAPRVIAVPEVVPPEIPMTVVTEAVIPERAAPATPAPVARPDGKLMPASVLPKVMAEPAPAKVVAEPAPRQVPPQVSTRAEDARMRLEPARVAPGYADTRKPAPVAPSYADTHKPAPVAPSYPETRRPAPVAAPAPTVAPVAASPAPPVRAVNVAVPAYVRPERPPQPAYIPPAVRTLPSDYVVRQPRPSTSTAAIIEVPAEIETGDGLVAVNPNLRHDPAWKLCQIDSRDAGRRNYRCTAYSYQPYGEGGYRPYGTYRNHQATPGYVVAPNARIISVDPSN